MDTLWLTDILTDRKMSQKKLTKDRIVFIKNKLKSESINCVDMILETKALKNFWNL